MWSYKSTTWIAHYPLSEPHQGTVPHVQSEFDKFLARADAINLASMGIGVSHGNLCGVPKKV